MDKKPISIETVTEQIEKIQKQLEKILKKQDLLEEAIYKMYEAKRRDERLSCP